MKITNLQAFAAVEGVQLCLAYEHPVSRSGVRQPTSLALVKLLKVLETNVILVQTEQQKMFEKAGAARKEKGLELPANSPHYKAVVEEVSALMAAAFEVGEAVHIKDLVCRDERGEYVPIEPRGDAYRLLGPLLVLE